MSMIRRSRSGSVSSPILTATGFRMVAKYRTCAPSGSLVQLSIQGKWVERFHRPSRCGTSRVSACFRFEMQPFVAGKEIHAIGLSQVTTSNGFHEGNRVLDFFHDLSVAVGVGGIRHEAQVPVFRVVQVGKSAVDQ